tara:strand:- start:12050 stop:12535 length:486 start_codon:yes stop_codon:yes gene_type:complete
MSLSPTWDKATDCRETLHELMRDLRSKIGSRFDKDRELTDTEIEREDSKLRAREEVREAYESIPPADRKKVSEPTEHDQYLAAEEADKDGEFPRRIVELNRGIKNLGMDIETLSYDINIETNYLRYLTAVESNINTADPGTYGGGARTEMISDPGRDEKVK